MLYDIIKPYRLILASQSPRRQYLLKELGLDFEVKLPPDVKEEFPTHLKGEEIPTYLSKLKAEAYRPLMKENDIVITADTIVYLNNKVLGKPADHDDAVRMIRQLSGNCHIVYTGVSITTPSKQRTFCAETNVYFRSLTEEEINFYITTCKPFDKAGAYGVQEWIGYTAIERLEGSYFNVMGLPIDRLWVELEAFLS